MEVEEDDKFFLEGLFGDPSQSGDLDGVSEVQFGLQPADQSLPTFPVTAVTDESLYYF